jgi:predicted Zn-dependent protease
MENPRIDWLRKQVELNPTDPRLRFGLALEYEKLERWPQVADELREYLALADDQGNAWGRLGRALRELGREGEAREAYRRGAEAARRHGHPSMAADFEEALAEMDA